MAESLSITDRENLKYAAEEWTPVEFHPERFSTTRFDEVARLLASEKGSLLDFGSGSGALSIAVAQRGFDKVVGVDVSDRRIDLARHVVNERFPDLASKLSFQCLVPGQPLPFADGAFDVVLSVVVLEVVPDLFATMDELARVCRPGGCCVFTVANVCYLKHVWSLLRGQVPLTYSISRDMKRWREQGWDDGALRYFSKAQLSDLLKHVGFEPEAWSGSGKWSGIRRHFRNWCGDLCVRARRVSRM